MKTNKQSSKINSKSNSRRKGCKKHSINPNKKSRKKAYRGQGR